MRTAIRSFFFPPTANLSSLHFSFSNLTVIFSRLVVDIVESVISGSKSRIAIVLEREAQSNGCHTCDTWPNSTQ